MAFRVDELAVIALDGRLEAAALAGSLLEVGSAVASFVVAALVAEGLPEAGVDGRARFAVDVVVAELGRFVTTFDAAGAGLRGLAAEASTVFLL